MATVLLSLSAIAQCPHTSAGSYIDILHADPFPVSMGNVVSSITSDANGYLYAAGWGDQDIFLQETPNPLVQPIPGQAFFWIAKYDPCSATPLQWHQEILPYVYPGQSYSLFSTLYYPVNNEQTHPFTPNVAIGKYTPIGGSLTNVIYMAFNASSTGFVAIFDLSSGTQLAVVQLDRFIVTDLKTDRQGEPIIAGYAALSGIGVTLSGGTVTFHQGDLFYAQIDNSPTTSSVSDFIFFKNLSPLNVGLSGTVFNGIPSLAVDLGKNVILSTADNLLFYQNLSTLNASLTPTAPISTTVSASIQNSRVVIDEIGNYFYVTDGFSMYQYSYTLSAGLFNTVTPGSSLTPPSGSMIYDMALEKAGNIAAITFNEVLEYTPTAFTPSANLMVSAMNNPYNISSPPPSNTYANTGADADAADRCIAYDVLNQTFLIGGSHPAAYQFQNTYWSSGNPFGFLASVYSSGTNAGDIYRVKKPASALSNSPAAFGVYPNPIKDQLNIETGSACTASYSLMATDGRIVNRDDLAIGSNSIATSALAPGIYLLRITIDGQIHTDKVSKQ